MRPNGFRRSTRTYVIRNDIRQVRQLRSYATSDHTGLRGACTPCCCRLSAQRCVFVPVPPWAHECHHGPSAQCYPHRRDARSAAAAIRRRGLLILVNAFFVAAEFAHGERARHADRADGGGGSSGGAGGAPPAAGSGRFSARRSTGRHAVLAGAGLDRRTAGRQHFSGLARICFRRFRCMPWCTRTWPLSR